MPAGGEVDRAPLTPVDGAEPAETPAIPLPAPLPDVPGADAPDAEITGPAAAPGGAISVPAGVAQGLPALTDVEALPFAAKALRALIVEAAKTGDIEKLRPMLGSGLLGVQLAGAPLEVDPVDYLKSLSGDGEGREILAILLDLLDGGFVLHEGGAGGPVYVWPYFVARDLNALTPEETVDLFRIATAGDLEEMMAAGGYNFYRIGITPEGRWAFFIAGQ